MLFQFHVTVETFESARIDDFIALCRREEVKPVMIHLEKGDYVDQPMMTRLIDAETLQIAREEVERQAARFAQAGFPIRRIKAECNPKENEPYLSSENYYEWHCLVEYSDEAALKQFCLEHHAHLSRNALMPGRKYVTIRLYDRDEFYRQVQVCSDALKSSPFTIVKEKFEYSVYDSCLTLDGGWA